MKQMWILFITLTCLFVLSCSEKPVEQLETIRTYNAKELSAKTLIDKVDFVKLETTDDNIIGSISKILFTDSLIIVVDKDKSKAVFVFDKNGRYLRKIGSFGGGPTEYGPICDVILSYDESKIHILCFRRLLTYDLNGEFLTSKKTNSIIHLIEYVDKDNFATFNYNGLFKKNSTGDLSLIQLIDKNFENILYSAVKSNYKENGFSMGYEVPLLNVNGKVYLLPELSDTVYQITKKAVTPKYHIKSNKMKPQSNEIINSAKNGHSNTSSRFNGGFYHINDYVIIYMIFSPTPLIFYHTKTKRIFTYDAYKLKDTHPLLVFTNTLKTQYKSSLVTVVSPTKLISRKENLYKYYDNKLIDRLFYNMTEDDNPILLFYHVNKNVPQ